MTIGENYLKNVKTVFLSYKALGEKAMQQLPSQQLFYAKNEDTNSIAGIIKHLHGNMLSRWTDFLTTDGEKAWRNRDGEFEPDPASEKEVLEQWEAGWRCLFAATDTVEEDQLLRTVYIRGEGLTVMEAINRQLAHYCYHVGQIVYAAKELKEGSWESLSIPRKIKQ